MENKPEKRDNDQCISPLRFFVLLTLKEKKEKLTKKIDIGITIKEGE